MRLPKSVCLPQAMALHWMLRRRGLKSTLVIGIAGSGGSRGADLLHAWVEQDSQPIFGWSDTDYTPIITVGSK